MYTLNPEFPVRCDRTFAASQDIADITQDLFSVQFGGTCPKTGLTLSGRWCLELDVAFRGPPQESYEPNPQPEHSSQPACMLSKLSLVLPDQSESSQRGNHG